MKISIVIPAKNEGANLDKLLPEIRKHHQDAEIIVVNDGSTDNTIAICQQHSVTVLSHPYSQGNGAAIKTGARNATGDTIVFMDGDGQHRPEDIGRLLEKLATGYDMVVGSRGNASQATAARSFGNSFYNRLASWMTGYKIADLTSGFRAVRKEKFKRFLYLLPNGFSYPTTSTMAFFRSGFPVAYVPIHCPARVGKSHIRLLKDGTRFFIIILKIGALFSPMRFFLPIAFLFTILGTTHYLASYLTTGRFTNMTALLYLSSLFIFLIGIVSEQVSSLHYRETER